MSAALALVVNDEPDIKNLLQQHLRRELRAGRIDMAFAASAARAVAIIDDGAGEREIILLLSDVNMAGMGGHELLARMRAARPDLPVNIFTAYSGAATWHQPLEGVANGVRPKPIDFAALRTEVERRFAAWQVSAP